MSNKISSFSSNNFNTVSSSGVGSSGSLGASSMSSSGASASPGELNSWYEAMARAWGSALDSQAGRIAQMSSQVSEAGQDQPSTMTVLTAESMRMQFMSQNASTSMTSVGPSAV